ncbi:hypothetical protein PVAG01_10681 [Phlyctema vagabunda]|uniref:Uncharacterized protein n=1 Tax=Phlyctema vagabunda TaxID=108571 RepID=A0ABR4P323_9HELO
MDEATHAAALREFYALCDRYGRDVIFQLLNRVQREDAGAVSETNNGSIAAGGEANNSVVAKEEDARESKDSESQGPANATLVDGDSPMEDANPINSVTDSKQHRRMRCFLCLEDTFFDNPEEAWAHRTEVHAGLHVIARRNAALDNDTRDSDKCLLISGPEEEDAFDSDGEEETGIQDSDEKDSGNGATTDKPESST